MLNIPTTRKVFCNRTLNMRSIRCIGYDMDYTLIHYDVAEWERSAYGYLKQFLLKQGWPIDHLQFEPDRACRGLILDVEKGNLIKANRFGFVKHAMHGTQPMPFDEQRQIYSRTMVDLAEPRWIFLNTLFSLSEGCMYAQLVDLLDHHQIPEVLGYADLYERVRQVLDAAHMEGRLKAEIIADPARFVVLDPEIPLTLLDQRHAGKKLMLVTNSEWYYTSAMMSYAFDRFLPTGKTWQSLFDTIIVSARKPHFFTVSSPFFEVVTEDGLLKPTQGDLQSGKVYLGGSARAVEKHLGLSGDEILYVGDHMFGDVHVTKNVLRWRTALILRELEEELNSITLFRPRELQVEKLMQQKEKLEHQLFQILLESQRQKANYFLPVKDQTPHSKEDLKKEESILRAKLHKLDEELTPLVQASGELNNPLWGLLMRAGNDKSLLAYQVERYADIYASRVSNFLFTTPFVYLRSPRGSLPHDVVE